MKEYYEINILDSGYPAKLKEIYDPPRILYCYGNLELLNQVSVAIVGSRTCTSYGKECAYLLSEKLSNNNVTVISGLAKGIDSESHVGALNGQNSTIAVMANGIDGCYPRENLWLRNKIGNEGLLISEHKSDYPPRRYDFPRRNRIISGLSEAVVVVEAKERSGSLITAEYALEQNKSLYAIPGDIFSPLCMGPNRLIREGAIPLSNFNDILYDLGIIPAICNVDLGADESLVFQYINRWGEVTKNDIASCTKMSEKQVEGMVKILEIKGLIKCSLGKIYVAN
ncbi:MAG: DNA-processing protein DprA [Clostridia bacterium]|nr:DNA-processing protein DprA [Clostridia bacterium]